VDRENAIYHVFLLIAIFINYWLIKMALWAITINAGHKGNGFEVLYGC
jgi:hypothetical protein